MPKTQVESVSAYVDAQPEAMRPLLDKVRSAIRKAVPEAEESISYQMPTYKLRGTPMLYFAAWKRHYSLYPVSADLLSKLSEPADDYEVEKDTLRFSWSRPVPTTLIARIAKLRAAEIGGSTKSPPKARSKTLTKTQMPKAGAERRTKR